MINLILPIIAFMVGHMVRDGWPALGTTHGARALGAAICAAPFVFNPLFAGLIFVGILAGFYFDMKHGEAAGVDTPTAVFDSFLSGVTSVTPVALLLLNPYILLVGLVKPLIWKLAWVTRIDNKLPWFEPTRIAAMAFGGAIAAGVEFLPKPDILDAIYKILA